MENFKICKDLLIIDVETSGIDPQTASIIQIGVVVFNKNGYLDGCEFEEYIKPYTSEWSKDSYKVHKIEKSFLEQKGKPLDEVLAMFENWASYMWDNLEKRYWLAQWSCGFDTSMLREAYRKINRNYPFHYRAFDIASIIRFHLAKQGRLYMKCGENDCAKALGIKVEENKLHNALYDARLSGLMLEKILKEK